MMISGLRVEARAMYLLSFQMVGKSRRMIVKGPMKARTRGQSKSHDLHDLLAGMSSVLSDDVVLAEGGMN